MVRSFATRHWQACRGANRTRELADGVLGVNAGGTLEHLDDGLASVDLKDLSKVKVADMMSHKHQLHLLSQRRQ